MTEHTQVIENGATVLLRGEVRGFDVDDGTYQVLLHLGVDDEGDDISEEV